jgi:tetratricopeptide (TPR) repeat protein
VAAWLNRAKALMALDRAAAARDSAETGLALAPLEVGLHLVRGQAMQALGDREAALMCFEAALALAPGDPEVHAMRAGVLYDQGDLAGALSGYQDALLCDPDHVFTLYNLARVRQETGDPVVALPLYDRAVALDPGHAPSLWNRQMCRLLMGDFSQWPRPWGGELRAPAVPRWEGEPLAGRRILLHIDQGLGDTLQFCRFVTRVAAQAGLVVLEVQPALVRLMRRSFGVTVIAQGDWHVPVDCHANIMELPGIFGISGDCVPADVPYLVAARETWQERLGQLPGRRVGLVWAGGLRDDPRNARLDRRRSLPAAALAPLAEVPGVTLVSLQKGKPADQAGDIPGLVDWTGALQDFADTADLVAGLDLVISVDTSVAHLAGALGVPVWLLNRFDSCWRWGLGREDCAWYPSLRQFRQTEMGNWKQVIEKVKEVLF